MALVVSAAFFLGAESLVPLVVGGVVWISVRWAADLYQPIALPPPEEVRRSFVTTLTGALVHVAVVSIAGDADGRWVGAVGMWTLLLILPWAMRQIAKTLLMEAKLFGVPVVVVGANESARALILELRRNREQGLHPVAVFDDARSLRGKVIEGIPVVGGIDDAAEVSFGYDVEHALVALDEDSAQHLRDVSERFRSRFTHVHVTPGFAGLANLWVQARSIGPLLTFEFRQDQFSRVTIALKRAFDAILGTVFFIVTLPIIAVCAILVKIVSPGPAFFSQVREGYRGRRIRVWKIRTMVPDAEQRLHQHLHQDSAARREWAERVKLDADPRVIPGLGRFLRQWSLDELPQLWNVMTGSMSLVGPRPFPEYHLSMFPMEFRELRRQVKPGVTGLWQVTYRTDGDLTHQRAADSYYVHNWSVWLDLWILLRTARVVFSGSGV